MHGNAVPRVSGCFPLASIRLRVPEPARFPSTSAAALRLRGGVPLHGCPFGGDRSPSPQMTPRR
eukprot:9331-Chlamydomonas_euryale.AAC.1